MQGGFCDVQPLQVGEAAVEEAEIVTAGHQAALPQDEQAQLRRNAGQGMQINGHKGLLEDAE